MKSVYPIHCQNIHRYVLLYCNVYIIDFFPRHRPQRKPLVSDNARAVMHVGIASPRWRGKPQFYVSDKRPMSYLSWRRPPPHIRSGPPYLLGCRQPGPGPRWDRCSWCPSADPWTDPRSVCTQSSGLRPRHSTEPRSLEGQHPRRPRSHADVQLKTK